MTSIRHPSEKECNQSCPCGSGKLLKDCCLGKVTDVLRIINNKEKPIPLVWLANRGYRDWSDLLHADAQMASEMQNFGESVEKPFVDFFRFLIDPLGRFIRYLSKQKPKK